MLILSWYPSWQGPWKNSHICSKVRLRRSSEGKVTYRDAFLKMLVHTVAVLPSREIRILFAIAFFAIAINGMSCVFVFRVLCLPVYRVDSTCRLEARGCGAGSWCNRTRRIRTDPTATVRPPRRYRPATRENIHNTRETESLENWKVDSQTTIWR